MFGIAHQYVCCRYFHHWLLNSFCPIFLNTRSTTQHLSWKNCTGFPFQNILSIYNEVACMCFNAINGSGPAYLSELLHVYTPSHTLHASSDTRMLKIQRYKREAHGFHTFSCFGPHIWNSHPQDHRHCSTLFKAKLKTFLGLQYFCPN